MTDLAGTLLSIGLAPLLGFLGQLRKTGSLFISDGALTGRVFLEGGRVVGAVFGSERGSAAFEAIVLMLGGGEFTLDEGVTERELNFMVDPKVLDEHLRRLSAERARFATVLPSLTMVPSLRLSGAEDDEVTVTVGALRLMHEVDGRRSVMDLAGGSGLIAAARGIAALVELGLVTLEPAQPIDAGSMPSPGPRPATATDRAWPARNRAQGGLPRDGSNDFERRTHSWFDRRGPGNG